MIIDFHTHIFPEKIAARTLEVLKDNTEKIEGARPTAHTDGTVTGLKRSMIENNIDYSVVLPIATTIKQSTTINNFAQSINNNNIFSLGSVHPMQSNWESELERIKELGLLGIKLHPEYQEVYIDSPECIRVLKKCEQLDLIVVLHAGKDVGMPPPVHCTPRMLSNALEYVDGSKIIAAHMGGWRMWDEVEKHLIGKPLYLDTSYSLHEMSDEYVIHIINAHSSKKILHATDSPWEKQGLTANRIQNLKISQDDKDNILYKNAMTLLKI